MNKQEFIEKYGLVEIEEKDNFIIDMQYSKKNNFTGEKLYLNSDCLIRKGTFDKLKKVQKELKENGYLVKIWDAYRPISIQKKMWKLVPDERYVTNPEKGNSYHCKGSAIDITLCDLNKKELEMPTKFDNFGIESHRNYENIKNKSVKDRIEFLEKIMLKNGFDLFYTEWWHFNDKDEYEIINEEYKQI